MVESWRPKGVLREAPGRAREIAPPYRFDQSKLFPLLVLEQDAVEEYLELLHWHSRTKTNLLGLIVELFSIKMAKDAGRKA